MRNRSDRFPGLFTACIGLFIAVILLGGCGAKQSTPTEPEKEKIAVINMDKAMQAHPKQAERTALAKQLNLLIAKNQAAATQSQEQADGSPVPSMPSGPDPRQAALEQQFQEKMLTKQAELNTALAAKQSDHKNQALAEYNEYAEKIDKEYQPNLFDIQLKLKTLQLTKEEMAALQEKQDKVSQEKAAKLAAKEKEVTAMLESQMKVAQQQATDQLNQYASEVHNALASEVKPDTAPVLPVPPVVEAPVTPAAMAADAQEIDQLKARLAALDTMISQEIENLCGKIAQAKGYAIVLTDVTVNVNAIDITSEVIAQFNK